MITDGESDNLETFKDCLSTTVIQRLAPSSGKPKKIKGRKNEIKPVVRAVSTQEEGSGDAAELADFIEYLAEEIFTNLPSDLRTVSYAAVQDDHVLGEKYGTPLDTALVADLVDLLPLSILDSLTTYNLINDASDLDRFLEPILTSYITSTTSSPPEYTPAIATSRPDGCEICERENIPLTYHHLIPRAVHAKVIKRGWHSEWELNKVAWLCRACHSFVHKIATNEVLAKELYSVDLLLEREDVVKWATWVSRVRWKAR